MVKNRVIGEAYRGLYARLKRLPGLQAWAETLRSEIGDYFENPGHGDFERWARVLSELPAVEPAAELTRNIPILGRPVADPEALRDLLMQLHPWRKGPLNLAGVAIDTEWRSDWKWQRVRDHLDLGGHTVLDIGAGNGYFGWRMLGAGAECVVGIDPTLVFVMQWLACRHFAGDSPNYLLPLRLEDLPRNLGGFDTVFSMGVLYHRRHPIAHLERLKTLVKPGGQVVLETLVTDGDRQTVLVPEGRYARMRNVWFIPSVAALETWLAKVGFADARLLDVSATTVDEQRSTSWMPFESLAECLDPDRPDRTVEGLPAPVRAAWLIST